MTGGEEGVDGAAARQRPGPLRRGTVWLVALAAVAGAALAPASAQTEAGAERERLPGFGQLYWTDSAPYVFGLVPDAVVEHPWRTDVIVFSVNPANQNFGQTEYKVTMPEGGALLYSWSASDPIYYEFHSNVVQAGNPGDAVLYGYGRGSGGEGTVTVQIDGIHGWFFQNTLFRPVEIVLRLAGNYTVGPGLRTSR